MRTETRTEMRTEVGGAASSAPRRLGAFLASICFPVEAGVVGVVLVAATGAVLLVLSLMLWPNLLARAALGHESHRPIDLHFGVAILVGCALPSVLARVCYHLIERRVVTRSMVFDYPKHIPEAARSRALLSWNYEHERALISLSRAAAFAALWGFITLLSVVAGVLLLLPPFHTPGEPFAGSHNLVGFALTSVAATRFLLDLVRMGRRTANDDVSKRMFAEALENQVLSVITALLIILLARLFGFDSALRLVEGQTLVSVPEAPSAGNATRVAIAIGLGAAVATVGAPVFELVTGRIRKLLGMSQPEEFAGTPLSAIPGLTPSDAERLKEEGVVSVESLASTPLPRLFLSTRYPLMRLCDWTDRALLILHLNPENAARVHAQLGVTGARGLGAAALEAPAVAAALRKALAVDNDGEAELVLQVIRSDDRVAMLDVYVQTEISFRPAA